MQEIDPDLLDMQAAAAGDAEAFGGIVGRHQLRLFNFFRKMGANIETAEDLTQETFLRLYRWRERYHHGASFKTFLFTLARHAWVDSLRKRGRTVSTTADEEIFLHVPHPESGSGAAELRMDMQQALNAISEAHREVVALHVYEGLNYQEISTVLSIPQGTVKSRMFNALRQLREILEKSGGGGMG